MTDTTVAIIGLDDHNQRHLEATPHGQRCRLRTLLPRGLVAGAAAFDIDELVAACERNIREWGTPDAVCTFWDLPSAEIEPIVAQAHGLHSASLESVVRVHHKFWSRLIQAKVVPESVPGFQAVDPYASDARHIDLEFPYWLKPIRAFGSQLAFNIRNQRDLDAALERIRAAIPRLGKPYDTILSRVSLPPEVEGIGGTWCIAEERIDGLQCTVEGYVHEGEPVVYGIIDSIRERNGSTFRRFQYPSRLPAEIQQAVTKIASETVRAMQYDGAPFNAEFFWDRRTGRIWLLEMNSRQSQSHAPLFEMVDGAANHEVMLALALGDRPEMPTGRGQHRVAAKWFLRSWEDGIVERVPSESELAALHDRYPNMSIHIDVAEQDRLADLPDQDSYSFQVGHVYAAASSQQQLFEAHRQLVDELPLVIAHGS